MTVAHSCSSGCVRPRDALTFDERGMGMAPLAMPETACWSWSSKDFSFISLQPADRPAPSNRSGVAPGRLRLDQPIWTSRTMNSPLRRYPDTPSDAVVSATSASALPASAMVFCCKKCRHVTMTDMCVRRRAASLKHTGACLHVPYLQLLPCIRAERALILAERCKQGPQVRQHRG